MEIVTKPKQKKLKLTPKQIFFVNEIVLGTPQTLAALKAYNVKGERAYHTAAAIASENLTKPNIDLAIKTQSETLKAALVEKGVTVAKVAERVNDLLDAKTPIYKNNNATKTIELVGYNKDYGAIDKGLKHALNIYGIEDVADKPKVMNTYNFLFNPEAQKEIREIEEKIKAKLINVRPSTENN